VKKLIALVVLFGFLLGSCAWAEPVIVIVTNSKNKYLTERIEAARKWLELLRSRNQLADVQLALRVVDLADPKVAEYWKKTFQIEQGDLPGLAYAILHGKKVADLGTYVRRFDDAAKAAGDVFKYAGTKDPSIKVTQVLTGLNIQSVPEGATVYLNGQEVGSTPLNELALPPNVRALIEIKHPDCEAYSRAFALPRGEVQSVQASLTPANGTLLLECPQKAKVSIDGTAVPAGLTRAPYTW
jgi:hypothetical protein